MDNLTVAQRHRCMRSIRSKNTDIEVKLQGALVERRLQFQIHPKDLIGRPDVIFGRARIAVFVDGDFWHGFRFTKTRYKMSEWWQQKIMVNIRRDRRVRGALRRRGWLVVRVWGHELKQSANSVADKLARLVAARCRPHRCPQIA